MRTDQFDFELPEHLIALEPARPRDAARMLVVGGDGQFTDGQVGELAQWLRAGDVLVLNDTRVIPAALSGRRRRGEQTARVDVMLHKRVDASRWRAFARPAKRLAAGDRIQFGASGEMCLLGALDATVEARGEGGEVVLAFDLAGPDLDLAIAGVGRVPLPPYIAGRRAAGAADIANYQTVFARRDGAVAAPTAGLHMTADLLARLAAQGVLHQFVTLHVGAGTFLPVKADDTRDHVMHSEWGEVTQAAANALNDVGARGGRIVAIGTTALRILETAAAADGTVRPFAGDTDIFITPGYRFRAVDLLMTNFHLPRSTLFMLVSAFAGSDTMRRAYAHAIAGGYRFYSYGDASLLHPAAAK